MKKTLLLLTLLLFTSTAFSKDSKSTDSSHQAHSDHDGHNHEKHDEHKGHDHDKHEGHDDHKDHDHDKHDDHDDHKGHDHGKNDDHKGHDDHSGHDHGGSKAIGKGKAIVEVDEKKGFKLSREAIKTLKLRLQNVDGPTFKIDKKTLVTSKDNKGVYRYRSGFFKLLQAKIIKELKNGYMVEVKGVDFGDQIVIDGIALLKVTDIYSTDKSEYGHSH
jgi:cobalamin biosynthesis protein CobT